MKNDIKQKYIKQQKKQKALNIVKWVLCGFGWTALLGAFVGLVALGCKGCANKKTNEPTQETRNIELVDINNSVVNTNGTLIYTSNNLPNNLSGSFNGFNNLYDFIADDLGQGSYGGGLVQMWNGGIPVGFELSYDLSQDCYLVDYYMGRAADVVISYKLTSSGFTRLNNSGLSPFEYTTNAVLYDDWDTAFQSYEIDEVNFWWGVLLGYNSELVAESGTTYFFSNIINRYAPLGLSNSEPIIIGDTYLGKHLIFSGTFKDNNGTLYKEIKVNYKAGFGLKYIDNRGDTLAAMVECIYFESLIYVNTNNEEVIVNKATYTTIDNTIYYTGRSVWTSNAYQTITIYSVNEVSGSLPIVNLNVISALNENTSYGSYDYNGLNNAFDLLSRAFQSIASILALQILPGVSLGIFVFIPVVITVVLFAVWLFKR